MNTDSMSSSQFVENVGKLERTSDWYLIDQQKIDQFAETTDDHQFIHVDPERVKAETPFDGTLAHGFLTLSMLSAMIGSSFPVVEDAALSLNYGFDKIRFLNPVPSGARIRSHIKLIESTLRKPGELLNRFAVTVEIENIERPALIAEWLGLAMLKKD